MRNVPALRLGAQVFFCVGILCLFSPFRQDPWFFFLLNALITASACVAARISRKLPRFFLSLVPGLAFLVPVSHWINIVSGIAILAYASVVVTFAFLAPEDSTYRKKARLLVGGGILFIVIALFVGEKALSSFGFLVCSVLLTLFALRMQQAAGSMGFAWQTGSAGMLCAVLGIGIGTGLLIWIFRSELLSGLLYFGKGAGSVLLFPVLLVLSALRHTSCITFPEESSDLESSIENNIDRPGDPPQPIPGTEPRTPFTLPEDFTIPWAEIVTALAVILLIVAAVWFIRSGRFGIGRQYRTQQADGVDPERQKKTRKAERRETADNRRKLRLLYGRYMSFLRENGVTFYPGMTTEDITDASTKLLLRNDRILRTLYRRARYSSEPVTDSDLAAARAAFDQLVYEKNRENGT